MPRPKNILAFDTSGPHCAAWLRMGAHKVQRKETLARGQAERIMPMLEELLSEGAATWSDLDAIAVGTGPGNFTGIRISVAAARGLSLGLGIPAVGVNFFEVLVQGTAKVYPGRDLLLCLAAPRDSLFLQVFRNEKPIGAARHFAPSVDQLTPVERTALVYGQPVECSRLGAGLEIASMLPTPEDALSRIESVASAKLEAAIEIGRPSPIYVRAPDAAPPKISAPTILR